MNLWKIAFLAPRVTVRWFGYGLVFTHSCNRARAPLARAANGHVMQVANSITTAVARQGAQWRVTWWPPRALSYSCALNSCRCCRAPSRRSTTQYKPLEWAGWAPHTPPVGGAYPDTVLRRRRENLYQRIAGSGCHARYTATPVTNSYA